LFNQKPKRMKKISLTIAAFAVVLAVVFTGCKKDDTTLPVITMAGTAQVVVSVGGTYTDLGATATDDVDGNITASIVTTGVSSVNTSTAGDYTITYTVKDDAGNEATATSTVKVRYIKPATYTVVETYEDATTWSYNQTVVLSASAINGLVFANFGGYAHEGIATITPGTNSVAFTMAEMNFTSDAGATRIYDIAGLATKISSGDFIINNVQYKSQIASGTPTIINQVYTIQ
jgi:hypothetical protein